MRYPLAILLPLRERDERAWVLERVAAARQLGRMVCERERREAAARRAEALSRAAGPTDRAAPASAFQAEALHAARRRAAWRAAERLRAEACAAVEGAGAVLEARREALAAAVRARGAIERHRDAWDAARRRERDAAAEVEAEDVRAGRAGG